LETEQRLLEDIRKGDKTAMRRLYDRYSGYSMALSRRYIADVDAVKDVLQDSFVKIITSVATFEYRGEGSLKAWILRIVANESLNYLRQANKFDFTDDIPDEQETDEPDVGSIPSKVLTDMIASLPVGYRTVLNLFVFEQKSHKEIARLLNIKEGTSASQYLRAKKILARQIKDYLKRNV
jgi:RNA polymerase sigma factor (sigma-70 family)